MRRHSRREKMHNHGISRALPPCFRPLYIKRFCYAVGMSGTVAVFCFAKVAVLTSRQRPPETFLLPSEATIGYHSV